GRQDGPVLDRLRQMLTCHGADFAVAPEAERSSLAQFARQMHLASLRWHPQGTPSYDENGYRVIPVDPSVLHLDYCIYTRRDAHTPLIARFLRFVRETADEFGPPEAARSSLAESAAPALEHDASVSGRL